jgi:hypothetical protein
MTSSGGQELLLIELEPEELDRKPGYGCTPRVAPTGTVRSEGAATRGVYLVPFSETDDEVLLRTIILSRKATRDYVGEG